MLISAGVNPMPHYKSDSDPVLAGLGEAGGLASGGAENHVNVSFSLILLSTGSSAKLKCKLPP